jgi:predicted  nucleic acid-binding Zn-ribbon protein
MNLTKLMDKVVGRQRERQQSRQADYRTLVAQIADGQEPDADNVHDVLGANGKTLDDLKADVECLEKRRGLKAQFDQLLKLIEEQQRIGKQVAAADHVFEEAERKHEEVTAPLCARLDQIKQAISQGEDARRRLWDTCGDPLLLAELKEVTTALAEVSGRRSKLSADARQLREWAHSDRAEVPHATTEGQIAELRQRADRRDARAAEIEAELIKLIDEEAALQHRESAIRERMLEA